MSPFIYFFWSTGGWWQDGHASCNVAGQLQILSVEQKPTGMWGEGDSTLKSPEE